MNREFLKEKGQVIRDAELEYEKLGLQLNELTREKIAEKFEVNPNAITTIAGLELEDFLLIGELVIERERMVARRKVLRDRHRMYHR